MRYLAIDLGDRRIGLALGDSVTGVVTPMDVVELGRPPDVETLARLAAEYGGDELVIGLPLNMDDTEGPAAKRARTLAADLSARIGRPVRLQDERLSSAEADWTMAGSGLTRGQKKQRRDALAAAAILRDYLQLLGRTPGEP
ncbi:MAG: Holliday junction resolvase RuvX [Phycisphaerales bacterium]|nr:Holliday junction resolvase RuvX [Phycisphaerales bacterium]